MVSKKGIQSNSVRNKARKLVQLQDLLLPLVPDAVQALIEELQSGSKMRIAAAKEILDRVYGKPAQAVELSGPNGSPIQYEQVVDAPPSETYEMWIARVQKTLDAPQKTIEQ